MIYFMFAQASSEENFKKDFRDFHKETIHWLPSVQKVIILHVDPVFLHKNFLETSRREGGSSSSVCISSVLKKKAIISFWALLENLFSSSSILIPTLVILQNVSFLKIHIRIHKISRKKVTLALFSLKTHRDHHDEKRRRSAERIRSPSETSEAEHHMYKIDGVQKSEMCISERNHTYHVDDHGVRGEEK